MPSSTAGFAVVDRNDLSDQVRGDHLDEVADEPADRQRRWAVEVVDAERSAKVAKRLAECVLKVRGSLEALKPHRAVGVVW
jgi:hypothetical protein